MPASRIFLPRFWLCHTSCIATRNHRRKPGRWRRLSLASVRSQSTVGRFIDAKPLTMVDLLLGISSGRVFNPGPHHASTNYVQWLARDEGSFDAALRNASFANTYTMGWEPYIVISRQRWRDLNADGMFHQRMAGTRRPPSMRWRSGATSSEHFAGRS